MEDFFIKVESTEYAVRTLTDKEKLIYEIKIGNCRIVYHWDLEKDVLYPSQTTGNCVDSVIQAIPAEIENHYFQSLHMIRAII